MSDDSELVKIELRTEDGTGGVDVETPWAKPLGNDLYQLDNSPFYAYGVSWQDIVEAKKTESDGFPIFTKIVEKSGNQTVRIIFDPPVEAGNESENILDELVGFGCSYEGANPSYIVLDIPKEVDLWKIREYLIDKGVQWEHADPTYKDLFPKV